MNCDQALEQISAALDGELTGSALAELEAHLASCPVCRALYDDLRAIQAGLLDSVEEAPKGFAERVMEAVAAEPAPVVKKASQNRRMWATAAAAAAVAALALLPQWGGLGSGRYGSGAAAPMVASVATGEEGATPAEDGAKVRSVEEYAAPAGDGMEKSASDDTLAMSPQAMQPQDGDGGAALYDAVENGVRRGAVVTVAGELPEGYTWDENGVLELAAEELPRLEAALEEAGIVYTVESSEEEGIVLVVRQEAAGAQAAP